MTSLTIRNIDTPLKARLRVRAAQNGHSMEQEVRQILKSALGEVAEPELHIFEKIKRRFADMGGVELDIPPRELARNPPDFSK